MIVNKVSILTFMFLCILHKFCIDASYVTLEASNDVIQPVLLKSLELRCSIRKYSFASSEGQTSNRSVSSGFHFDQLLSLVITKINNIQGENETIASVTGCSTPVIEKSFLNIVQAEGSSEESPEKDEQGYLRLTWDRPNDKHAANYTCEVSYLNSDKHSNIISTSLNIVSIEPKISDLVTYISDNERTIVELTRRISDLQANHSNFNNELGDLQKNFNSTSEIINNRLDSIKGQNSETGELQCLHNSITYVTFTKPFTKAPLINLMLSYLYVSAANGQQFKNSLTYVNTTGFGVNCERPGSALVHFRWLAIDL